MPIELRLWAQKLKDKVMISIGNENEQSYSRKQKKLPPLPREESQSKSSQDPDHYSYKNRRSSVGNRDRNRNTKSLDLPRKSRVQNNDPRSPDRSSRRYDSSSRRDHERDHRERRYSTDTVPRVRSAPENYRDQKPAPDSSFFHKKLSRGLSFLRKPVALYMGKDGRRPGNSREDGRDRKERDGDRKDLDRGENTNRSSNYMERREKLKARDLSRERKHPDRAAEAKVEDFEGAKIRGQAMKGERRRIERKSKGVDVRREVKGRTQEEKQASAKAQNRRSLKSASEDQSYQATSQLNVENLSEFDKLFLDDGQEESVLGRGIGNMNRTVLEGFARVPEKYWNRNKKLGYQK